MNKQAALNTLNNDYPDKPVWTLKEMADLLGLKHNTLKTYAKQGKMPHAQRIGMLDVFTRDQVVAYLSGQNIPVAEVEIVGSKEAAEILGISRRSVDIYVDDGRLSCWQVSWGDNKANLFAPQHLVKPQTSKYEGLFTEVEEQDKVLFRGRLYNREYAKKLARDLGLV